MKNDDHLVGKLNGQKKVLCSIENINIIRFTAEPNHNAQRFKATWVSNSLTMLFQIWKEVSDPNRDYIFTWLVLGISLTSTCHFHKGKVLVHGS